MNSFKNNPSYVIFSQGLCGSLWRRLGCLFAAGLTFALFALVLPVRADVVILDNHFNDPNNNIGLNTNGIGSGFTIFTAAQGGVIESNSFIHTLMRVNGADRAVFCSINSIPVGAAGTRYEFRNVQFEKQPSSTGTGATDRLLIGVQDRAPAGDFIEAGPANMPNGFWIQFMSDSEVNGPSGGGTGTGNGGWGTLNGSSPNTILFHKDRDGTRTILAGWRFDNLNWGQLTPDNFSPALNITLTLSATTWALNITGDTHDGGNPISYSGNYSDYGIKNALTTGLNNNVFVCAEGQNEDPGINILVDRVVVTHTGNLIVPTPLFSTPEYGFATNSVRAGEFVGLSISATSSVATPTFQWQMEDSSVPGTFTNFPGGTGTNIIVNTIGLGDSVGRGIRVIANDGLNSVTSAVVTLTVGPGVAPTLVQDTTPPGPETRNIGLSISYSASFSGNLPMTNQWQKSPDGVTWTNIPNATNPSLLLAGLTAGDAGYYRLVVSNLVGSAASTASQLITTNGNIKFLWSAPVPFASLNLNANQILTNFPGTKIAGALRGNGGPTTVSLTPNPNFSTNIVFAARGTWAEVSGAGTGNNAFPGTNAPYTTTGNANFNTCLSNYRSDGFTHIISLSNLVVGQQYSVQLFALDGRSLNPGANTRTANYQDPNDPLDVSVNYSMADFVYIVGTFYASNTVEEIQQNLLNPGGQGNFNCLVLRAVGWNPPPYITGQPNNAGGYVGETTVLSGGSAAGDATIPSPTIVYQWKAGPSGGPYTNLIDGAKYSGANSAALTVKNLAFSDASVVYVLTASNGGGSTMSREVTINVQSPPSHDLLGHWLSGAASFADTANFIAPGTFDGFIISNGIVGAGGNYYFTNDVPPGGTGQSLYLFGNTGVIISNTSTADLGYRDTFDNGMQARFSIGFWAKGFPGTWNPWVSKDGEANGYQQRRNAANNFAILTVRGATAAPDPGGNINSNDGRWHYYAGTFDTVNGQRNFYVDGQLSQQTLGNTPFSLASAAHLMIGARESGGTLTYQAYFTGYIYDVRIYDYALSQQEIGTIGKVSPPMTSQVSSGKVILTWPFGTLVQATNLLGPWTPVAGATSPYTNTPTAGTPQLFFRVSNP